MEKNQVEKLLNINMFIVENTGGNCQWATRKFENCFIAITRKDDPSLPQDIYEPITVGFYYGDDPICFCSINFLSLEIYFLSTNFND